MTSTTTAQKIALYITALPGERIKAAMQAWSAQADTSIEDLVESLANESIEQERTAIEIADAAVESPTFKARFPSMTEAEMVAASKEAHAEHVANGRKGYTQSEMESWVATLQTSS